MCTINALLYDRKMKFQVMRFSKNTMLICSLILMLFQGRRETRKNVKQAELGKEVSGVNSSQ